MKKILMLGLCSIICLLTSCSWITITDSSKTTNSTSISHKSNENTPKPKPTKTHKSTTTPEPKPTKKQIIKADNFDLALITKTNHPVLFSSTESAHKFWKDKKGFLGWKDREDKKIIYPDTINGNDWTSCILEMNGDMNFGNCYNDYIFGIHIYIDKFDTPVKLKLHDALSIAASYLPFDTLSSYYKLNYSTSYKATKALETKDRYYDISYLPQKNIDQKLVLNKHSYDFPCINITLRENENKYITEILIDLHQSICLSGRNSIAYGGDYKKIKWKYDFIEK